jgi:hypothetical protein
MTPGRLWNLRVTHSGEILGNAAASRTVCPPSMQRYPHHERHTVRFHNFAQLQAAHDAATAIGKPRDYFTSTAYFRRQRRAMIQNFVYPYTPSIVWNVLGKVRGRPSPTA